MKVYHYFKYVLISGLAIIFFAGIFGCKTMSTSSNSNLNSVTVTIEHTDQQIKDWYRVKISNMKADLSGFDNFMSDIQKQKTKLLKKKVKNDQLLDSNNEKISGLIEANQVLVQENDLLESKIDYLDIAEENINHQKLAHEALMSQVEKDKVAFTEKPKVLNGKSILEMGVLPQKTSDKKYDEIKEFFEKNFPNIELFEAANGNEKDDHATEKKLADNGDFKEDYNSSINLSKVDIPVSISNNGKCPQPTFAVLNGKVKRKESESATAFCNLFRKKGIHVNRVSNAKETYWSSVIYAKDRKKDDCFIKKLNKIFNKKIRIMPPYADQLESVVFVIGEDKLVL